MGAPPWKQPLTHSLGDAMTPEQKRTLMSIATGETAASAASADAASKPESGGPLTLPPGSGPVSFPPPPSGGGGGGSWGGPAMPPAPTGDPWVAQPTFGDFGNGGDMIPFPGGGDMTPFGGPLQGIIDFLTSNPTSILPMLGMLRRLLPNFPGLGDDRDNLFDTGQCSYMYDTLPKAAQDALAAWWCGMSAPIGLSAEAQKYFLAIAVSRNPPPREDCCRR